MRIRRSLSKQKKVAWIGFFVVCLTGLAVANKQPSPALASETPLKSPSGTIDDSQTQMQVDIPVTKGMADEAYRQALHTLSGVVELPPQTTPNIFDPQSHPLLNSLFPNQQGPIASIIRIVLKLQHQAWIPQFLKGKKDRGNTDKRKDDMEERAVKVLDLLEYAIELGHMEALYKLGHVSLFHLSPVLHNSTRAFDAYSEHATLTGNATSQAILGFFYATGYDNVVPIDQAKSLLHYTFAAHGGDQGAQMTMAYRHWAGIGVNDDCQKALEWYQQAAEQSMETYLSGPPGGRTMLHTATKLSDLDGGAYGPGASVASTGVNAHRSVMRAAASRQAGETWEDVLEYYMFNADRGETDFSFRLGKIFYQGSIYSLAGGASAGAEGVGAMPRDYARARAYFLRIARQIWPRDTPGQQNPPPKQEQKEDGTVSFAAASAGYLGRMYLRGEGVKQDMAMAKLWFERGVEYKEKESLNGLGIMLRDGLINGKKDLAKALQYFGAAAVQELPEAQVNLGKYYYEQKGDTRMATTYFDSAMRHGSPYEPYFYLGEIYATTAQNPSTPSHMIHGSCAMALSYYKVVAERGAWLDDPVRDGETRWKIGTDRAKEDAMLRWQIASERGIETAQNNLAYILDQDKSLLRSTRFAPQSASNDTARLALTQWMRSAYQRNVDALVKVGDYYYHGLGVSNEPEKQRWERAATFYQSAVDTQTSALAMWNLGWMYENGIGVPQDFHLAKRNYDLALETNSEAYLPVTLSLIKLYARSLWHTICGGENGLSFWPETAEYGYPTEPAGIDGARDEADVTAPPRQARDDHRRRTHGAEKQIEEDPDFIEWARRRKQEAGGDGDFGPEDYFDSAIRGPGRREDEDADDFAETMVLLVLCLMVSVLMYVRTRWVERRRREQEERNGAGGPQPAHNQGGLGVFPPPGDPARDEWAVMR